MDLKLIAGDLVLSLSFSLLQKWIQDGWFYGEGMMNTISMESSMMTSMEGSSMNDSTMMNITKKTSIVTSILKHVFDQDHVGVEYHVCPCFSLCMQILSSDLKWFLHIQDWDDEDSKSMGKVVFALYTTAILDCMISLNDEATSIESRVMVTENGIVTNETMENERVTKEHLLKRDNGTLKNLFMRVDDLLKMAPVAIALTHVSTLADETLLKLCLFSRILSCFDLEACLLVQLVNRFKQESMMGVSVEELEERLYTITRGEGATWRYEVIADVWVPETPRLKRPTSYSSPKALCTPFKNPISSTSTIRARFDQIDPLLAMSISRIRQAVFASQKKSKVLGDDTGKEMILDSHVETSIGQEASSNLGLSSPLPSISMIGRNSSLSTHSPITSSHGGGRRSRTWFEVTGDEKENDLKENGQHYSRRRMKLESSDPLCMKPPLPTLSLKSKIVLGSAASELDPQEEESEDDLLL